MAACHYCRVSIARMEKYERSDSNENSREKIRSVESCLMDIETDRKSALKQQQLMIQQSSENAHPFASSRDTPGIAPWQ